MKKTIPLLIFYLIPFCLPTHLDAAQERAGTLLPQSSFQAMESYLDRREVEFFGDTKFPDDTESLDDDEKKLPWRLYDRLDVPYRVAKEIENGFLSFGQLKEVLEKYRKSDVDVFELKERVAKYINRCTYWAVTLVPSQKGMDFIANYNKSPRPEGMGVEIAEFIVNNTYCVSLKSNGTMDILEKNKGVIFHEFECGPIKEAFLLRTSVSYVTVRSLEGKLFFFNLKKRKPEEDFIDSDILWKVPFSQDSKLILTRNALGEVRLKDPYSSFRLSDKSEEEKQAMYHPEVPDDHFIPSIYRIGDMNYLLYKDNENPLLSGKYFRYFLDNNGVMVDRFTDNGGFVREWIGLRYQNKDGSVLQDNDLIERYEKGLISNRRLSALQMYKVLLALMRGSAISDRHLLYERDQEQDEEAWKALQNDRLPENEIESFPIEIEQLIIGVYCARTPKISDYKLVPGLDLELAPFSTFQSSITGDDGHLPAWYQPENPPSEEDDVLVLEDEDDRQEPQVHGSMAAAIATTAMTIAKSAFSYFWSR